MRATSLALAGLLALGAGGAAAFDDDDRLRKTDDRRDTRDDDRLYKDGRYEDDDWDEDDCEDWDDRECWRTSGRSRDLRPRDARRFRGLDTNRDGRITRGEWRGNDRSFRNHDRDGDGVIRASEMSRQRGARRASRGWRGRGEGREHHVWDRDGDGRLERREWRDDADDFRRLDRNRDGWLSRSELRRD